MFSCLLLGAALTLGQTPTEEQTAPPVPAAPPPDRWFLMQSLQGTYEGPEIRGDDNGPSRPFENKHGLLTTTANLSLRW